MKGVDTNVLVRYLTRDDAAQERAAARFLETMRARSEPILVNVIVLCELAWVLGRSYDYTKTEVARVIEQLLRTEQIVVEDTDLAWQALTDFRESRWDFADCLIGRKNQRLGCDATATFDARLHGLAGFVQLKAR